MNQEEIKQCIPHREPFLWLDEVTQLEEGRIQGRKFIDPELPVFQGHYPEFPVLPGVLLCEAAFQAGAVLIAKTCDPDRSRMPVVTRQNKTKFKRMVRPGETIDVEVTLNERMKHAFFLSGRISVEGETAVQLEFAVAGAPVSAAPTQNES